ncbi:hypothetical protein CcaverHIS002_0203010 [Cutaneotrichosporon cavernicola]|uniref:Hamartin n=1 Tax=Cutaneotrichosporon cavernicola TaxID=279322 RepID=A0AA48KY26_9TREE|nr:uncharacterized protein CcaverHIS019_0203010 [Cutaneotrichosporon cavernicola]BEI81141.1 hypothetical protein CcaverHIS002_0203010 [Cutaneotrichosporon cavernicola]BEI88939.1 hypothetical protein CcaverHIS019_0203010 [Cutaneotrichosporon cavernicola]BEI96716.1 hypothetical protein CcaverHIS631_0203050 [Cutaneotrichosporon cavernicola]
MSTAAEVLERLEGFPQDLSDLVLPELSGRDVDELVVTLDSLAHANDTPEARNAIVQVSTLLPPHKLLEQLELAWVRDAGALIAPVVAELARSLTTGTYDVHAWTKAAAQANTERSREVVGAWAAQNFETFLEVCKDLYPDPSVRLGVLNIVKNIVLGAPYTPDMPIASTPMAQLASHDFFPVLLKSLLLDTSNHLFGLGLATLVTILPFSVPLLRRYIPLLMVVLGRAMCWRDRPFYDAGKHKTVGVTTTPAPSASMDWTVATTGEDIISVPTPTEKRVVQLLLVGLYGAWPSNIIAFIRDQPAYFEVKQVATMYAVPWEEVWAPGQLQARCVPLISDFMLHHNVITHTSSQEMADEKRWERFDPSEFISMAYLMSGGSEDADAMFEFFRLPKVQLDPLEHGAREAEPTVAGSSSDTSDIRRLQMENELLRLESLYNDRLRRQFVHHIGRLHRNSLRFNSDEAEIHNFVNRLKEQSKTIATLTHDLTTQRSESTQAQQKHVKWQEQLRDKVAGFREERRNWMTEATRLRTELAEGQAAAREMRDELGMVKNERFNLQAQLLELGPKVRHIEDYETRVKQLTDAQLLWDEDVTALREAQAAAIASQARCAELETMLRAREKICREQSETITKLESRPVKPTEIPSETPRPAEEEKPPAIIDPTFHISVAENVRKRAERLERDNLELTVEVERLRRMTIKDATGGGSASSLLYGGA